ncbi:Oxidoreductase NAD-binding domain-containing protein 1 [Trichoderma ghanense]|uniref:Oxidoreductase NAD-binding domain-containing protein 1 n=1 Tax=Trichoderma ghanense TaxID=65468 RepID=A0ABY2GX79_9HYPO
MSSKKDRLREGHLERTADEPRNAVISSPTVLLADLHEVQLERIEQVNERVRLFRLRLLSGPAKFLPGQWLDTYIPGVPKAGGFTITSAPSSSSSTSSSSEPPYFELAVQESPENEPAAWLWRPAGEILGERLRVRVGGRFVFPPLVKEKDASAAVDVGGENFGRGLGKVVFVAGGVGVNPLVSMLSYIADNSAANGQEDLVGEVVFLYASKLPRSGNLSDILFLDRITRVFGEGRVRGRVKLFVTGTTAAASSLQGAAGGITIAGMREMNGTSVEVQRRRITSADVEDAVGDGRDPGTVVYVCGPRGMTDEIVERLAGFIDSGRVLTEKWW